MYMTLICIIKINKNKVGLEERLVFIYYKLGQGGTQIILHIFEFELIVIENFKVERKSLQIYIFFIEVTYAMFSLYIFIMSNVYVFVYLPNLICIHVCCLNFICMIVYLWFVSVFKKLNVFMVVWISYVCVFIICLWIYVFIKFNVYSWLLFEYHICNYIYKLFVY